MANQFEVNEILKNPSLDLKNIIRDNIYPSDDDSIICSRMDSNYYELDRFISLQGSYPLRDKYRAIHTNFLARLEERKYNLIS